MSDIENCSLLVSNILGGCNEKENRKYVNGNSVGSKPDSRMWIFFRDGEKADAKKEKKDVSELVIGEMEYSVVEDGGWAQSMHEGLVKACENVGIDTKTNLITMEEDFRRGYFSD